MADRLKPVTNETIAKNGVQEGLRSTGAKTTAELMGMPQEKEGLIRVMESLRPEVFTSKEAYESSRKDLEQLRKVTDPTKFAELFGAFYGKIKTANGTDLNDVAELDKLLASGAASVASPSAASSVSRKITVGAQSNLTVEISPSSVQVPKLVNGKESGESTVIQSGKLTAAEFRSQALNGYDEKDKNAIMGAIPTDFFKK